MSLSLSLSLSPSLQDGERLSSSVADDLQVWFSSLTIDNIAVPTPVPSLLVSDHDHQEEKEEGMKLTTPIPVETPPPLADGVAVNQNNEPPLSTTINDNKTEVAPEWTAEDEDKGQICEGYIYIEKRGLLNNGYYQGKREGDGDGDREGTMNGDSESIERQNSGSGRPEEEEARVSRHCDTVFSPQDGIISVDLAAVLKLVDPQ